MKKIFLGAFAKLGQDALAVYVGNALAHLLVDEQFKTLMPSITELKAAYDVYVVALANNVNGGRRATIDKNKAKQELMNWMSLVARSVDILAKGDESILMAAGLDVCKAASSYDFLAAPDVVKLTNETEAGVVTVQLSDVDGSTNYGVEKRLKIEGQETAWTNGEYSSAQKFQLANLQSGKTYQFQFRAIGNKGLVSAWSSVVETLVS